MNRLSKDDLGQMNRDYFQGLKKDKLVEVAENLHALAVEQLERLEKNSDNSSRPPSSDSPYEPEEARNSKETDIYVRATEDIELLDEKKLSESPSLAKEKKLLKRPPGKQLGAKGYWRTIPLVPKITIPHYPHNCAACNGSLKTTEESKPYMGYYVLELEKKAAIV